MSSDLPDDPDVRRAILNERRVEELEARIDAMLAMVEDARALLNKQWSFFTVFMETVNQQLDAIMNARQEGEMSDTDVSIEAFVSAQQQISQMLSEIQRVTNEHDTLQARVDAMLAKMMAMNDASIKRWGERPMTAGWIATWLDAIANAGQEGAK